MQVTPDITGTMVARVIPAGARAPSVYVRTTCNDPATDLQTATCSSTSYDPTRITLAVSAGRPLWLFVDGIDSTSGVATLTVQITP